MEALAVWLGNFIGAILAQCAPVLVQILKEAIQSAFTSTVETSNGPYDLRKRLLERLRSSDNYRRAGNSGTASRTDISKDLGV